MKRMLILSLALLLTFTAPALAFNYARFAGLEGVTVDYDPENPSASVVKAGFSDSAYWSQFGGHLVVRYLNAGKDEDLPLISSLASYSGDDRKREKAAQYAKAALGKIAEHI